MLAFTRDEHISDRHVIIEKREYRCLSPITKYNFHLYDTVEVIIGKKRRTGLISSYAYRAGTRTKNNKHIEHLIIGFAYLWLIEGCKISKVLDTVFLEIGDNTKKNKIIHIHPCRIVLIEKNIVGAVEKMRDAIRNLTKDLPIIGG
jgi:hypothetical protein